ncbi:hypothetical protein HF521_016055 [Silurus meridionalis]|uniref:NADH dehydrogenase [ubiquinone] 1 beta subcomplex subunit 3 n=1 Tax=Silurus meridionalis TaxID=175797 RepID=A0A8T0BQT0_SILME|nr:hypothetical protein HF521_016055 [Silurus meridionalis]
MLVERAAMGGDHGHSKLPMPDYKAWKCEGTPLELTQQRLARRGLRDPWASFREVLMRGFRTGLVAFAVALAVEYTFFPPKKSEH